MKTAKVFYATTALTLLLTVSAMAQSDAKVIAVVTKADWCSVCKANGERAMTTFMKNNEDGTFKFYSNDVTNEQTKKQSATELKKCGVDKVMEKYQGTGLVSFFNADTKDLISQVSVSESDNKLAEVMKTAKNGLK